MIRTTARKPIQRKLKITQLKYNEKGVLVNLTGSYNVLQEEFYPVERHYEHR